MLSLFRRSVLVALPTLALTLSLAACQSTQRTLTSETDEEIARELCRVVKVVKFSRQDTPETIDQNRANNAALRAYCKE